jgi:hypothetical protein
MKGHHLSVGQINAVSGLNNDSGVKEKLVLPRINATPMAP